MSIIITLAAFLITIGFIILIHEGGHFIAAKLARMWVHELAIGLGPRLFRFRIRETIYSLRLIPFGGYVRVAGDETSAEEDAEVPSERLFPNRPPWSRMAMVLAGPTANVLAALLIMISVVGLIGIPYLEVYQTSEGGPAAQFLRPGDRITKIEGRPLYFLAQLQQAVQRQGEAGLPVTLEAQRGQEVLHLSIRPKLEEGRYIIGVYFTASGVTHRVPFPASIAVGAIWMKEVVVAQYLGFKAIFSGKVSAGEALTGPVGIASLVGRYFAQGLLPFLTLVALLSLLIGLFNLIPFPALDGSRAAFILYELVRGKPISPEREGWVHYIGFIILIGLMLLITYNDILRLIRGR
ncbi:MAG: RIP metalloprotease [Candidatus Bipolaricaulia bacterium]